MPPPFPPADTRHPVILRDGSGHPGVVFLNTVIDNHRIQVGDYTYASAFDPPADWGARLAPYLHIFSPETLTIGKFCQIADGVTFITASAHHRYDGFSSYPFAAFGGGKLQGRPSNPDPGRDTCVGHDVWFGQGVTVLPGAEIGSGVIIGAGAVVGGQVAPYSVVGGNPARVIRRRFDAPTVEALLEIAWWDWPIARIIANEAAICGADLTRLRAAAPD